MNAAPRSDLLHGEAKVNRPPAYSSYFSIFLLLLAAWAIHAVWQLQDGGPIFPFDDSYITLHNARVLLSGNQDPSFPGTPALLGATSPVHLALVALFGLALPLSWASDTVLWVAALLYALGLCRLALIAGASPLVASLFTCAAMLAGRTPHQLLNGLETGLAMASITWALALAADRKQRPLALGALCGLMPFLRPELGVLSLLLICSSLTRQVQCGQSYASATRMLCAACSAAALSALPWVLWTWSATDSPIPATIGAKRAWFAEGGLPTVIKNSWVGASTFGFLISFGFVSLAGMALLFRTALGWFAAAFVVILIAVYYVQFPGALGHYEGRYLYVIAPVLLFGVASAFRLLSPGRQVLFAGILLLQTAMFAPLFWREHVASRAFTAKELEGVAAFCRRNLPADAIILIHDAGYIAWATPFQMADLVGLKTPTSISDHRELTLPSGGAQRPEAIARIATRSRATYLVVLRGWRAIYRIPEALASQGWSVVQIRTDGAYQVFQLAPPRQGG
jgi:hypothetical protein